MSHRVERLYVSFLVQSINKPCAVLDLLCWSLAWRWLPRAWFRINNGEVECICCSSFSCFILSVWVCVWRFNCAPLFCCHFPWIDVMHIEAYVKVCILMYCRTVQHTNRLLMYYASNAIQVAELIEIALSWENDQTFTYATAFFLFPFAIAIVRREESLLKYAYRIYSFGLLVKHLCTHSILPIHLRLELVSPQNQPFNAFNLFVMVNGFIGKIR